MTGTGEAWLFWILGAVAVLGSLGLLFARKAVHAALGMGAVMVILGIFYLALEAPFLGVVHIFVYSGAVMMLFVFVLMLVGVDHSDSLVETIRGHKVTSFIFTVGLALLLLTAVGSVTVTGKPSLAEVNADPGNVQGMANLIFGRYVWVFEVTSALLITAALGAMVLAHRERLAPKPTQRQWSERRFREGGDFLAGLPVPGVYARHNAVDTPALLPDGSIAAASVSRVLNARGQVNEPGQFSSAELNVEREIEEGSER
ncbi:NADH-quinone oxidoreductase subunit J [Janibacter sp. G56]|uniref:NADH-quinone oxidoreductase subunit J n=1 Tax=Janibacter sp. G56 TaxID=3418717 RepID=UPI003D08F555